MIILIALSSMTACTSNTVQEKAYTQLSQEEKSETSPSKAKLQKFTLTLSNIAQYDVPKKYLGKTVEVIIFPTNNAILGDIKRIYYQGQLIGQGLRE